MMGYVQRTYVHNVTAIFDNNSLFKQLNNHEIHTLLASEKEESLFLYKLGKSANNSMYCGNIQCISQRKQFCEYVLHFWYYNQKTL